METENAGQERWQDHSLSDGDRVLAVPAGIIFPRTIWQLEYRGEKSTESGSSRIEKTLPAGVDGCTAGQKT